MKKLFLIAVLVVSANIAFAQDKYEFMTISYQAPASGSGDFSISIDGKDFLIESAVVPKANKSTLNTNPLLLKVKEYQDKSWEVMSFNMSTGVGYIVHTAYLKKKKN